MLRISFLQFFNYNQYNFIAQHVQTNTQVTLYI